MGAAAYSRGNKCISAQFAAEANATVPVNRRYLSALEAHNERLARDKRDLTARLERAMLHLRERRATLTAERAAFAADRERLTRRAHEAERAMLAFRRRWEWVSRLLRRLASPAAVAEVRAEMEAERAARGAQ